MTGGGGGVVVAVEVDGGYSNIKRQFNILPMYIQLLEQQMLVCLKKLISLGARWK